MSADAPQPIATPEEHLARVAIQFEATIQRHLGDPQPEVRGAAELANRLLYHHQQRALPGFEVTFGYLCAELDDLATP